MWTWKRTFHKSLAIFAAYYKENVFWIRVSYQPFYRYTHRKLRIFTGLRQSCFCQILDFQPLQGGRFTIGKIQRISNLQRFQDFLHSSLLLFFRMKTVCAPFSPVSSWTMLISQRVFVSPVLCNSKSFHLAACNPIDGTCFFFLCALKTFRMESWQTFAFANSFTFYAET